MKLYRIKPVSLRRFICGAVLLIMAVMLCACGRSTPAAVTEYLHAPAIETGGDSFKIAVASDLHVDPDADTKILVDQLYAWNIEITKALLWSARQDGADLLVITGDITNASRHEQHEALLELLNEAKENGLKILILDGNHDIGKTTPEEFAGYYADFGYADAHSRDEASLSYSVRLPQVFIILVDTGGYTGSNLSGTVTAGTLSWLEKQLKEAQEAGLPAFVLGHYPLLTAQSGEFIGLEEMKELLLRYRVPLYICGHMHGRHIELEDTLCELVVERATSYPCSYALLTQHSGGELQYEPRMIDMEGWARAEQINEPVFLEFDRYREIVFRSQCRELVDNLRENREVSERQTEKAFEFYYDFQYALSNGHLFRELDNLKNHDGYSSFMKIAKGTVYERWVRSTLEYNLPYSEGFMIIGNVIYSTAED